MNNNHLYIENNITQFSITIYNFLQLCMIMNNSVYDSKNNDISNDVYVVS